MTPEQIAREILDEHISETDRLWERIHKAIQAERDRAKKAILCSMCVQPCECEHCVRARQAIKEWENVK